MSDADENDEIEQEDGKAPKALRDQNSKLNKQLQDALALVEKFQQESRKNTIADALREKGANPKLAKYISRDLEGDVTVDAVDKWLDEEGELFGYKPADADEDEDAQEQERISAATAKAPQPQVGWTTERLKGATDQQLIDAGYLEPR